MPDHVSCPRCHGTGRAPLKADLQATLDAARGLAERGRALTAIAVAAQLDAPVGPTAINARMEALVAAGFLRRRPRREKRRITYELVEEADVV